MQTGFVGLGAMGAHMARSLHRAGLLTGVWNRTADKAAALAKELGCHAFTSLIELAGNCEAVVICVSADDDVRAVIAGLEPGLNPNMIVMDCSTVAAGTARDTRRLPSWWAVTSRCSRARNRSCRRSARPSPTSDRAAQAKRQKPPTKS